MKIYIGNLPHETIEPQLRESFEKFGEVTSLDIIRDRGSGKPRGCAFVEKSSDENAQKAITGLHSKDLAGRLLKVNEARKD